MSKALNWEETLRQKYKNDLLTPCGKCDKWRRMSVLHRTTNEWHEIDCPCQFEFPVEFVFQQMDCSCMVACVAMIAGKSEDYIMRNHYSFEHDFSTRGSYLSQATDILDKHFGFAYQTRHKFYAPTRMPREDWLKPWGPLHLAEVQNLRDSGQHGVVVLEDGTVLDPACGIIQGLHRYPRVMSMTAFYKVK